MGFENLFKRSAPAEKSEAQREHDEKTKREAGMIGLAAVAAAAGAGAAYQELPDLHANPNAVGTAAVGEAPAERGSVGGVTIEKDSSGAPIIRVPAEGMAKQVVVDSIENAGEPVHIELNEKQVRVDSIEH